MRTLRHGTTLGYWLLAVVAVQLMAARLSGPVTTQSPTIGPILPSADARVGPILPSASATLRPTAVADAAVQTSAAVGIQRVNVASDGAQANAFSTDAALSSDGRFVVFSSDATNLVPGDTNNVRDVFVRDRLTGVTTRESLGSAGQQANAECIQPAISTDGRYVAFLSRATNLLAGVVTTPQIYVRDRQLGLTFIASVSSNGSPANNSGAFGGYAFSANGRFVSFTSFATNLVPGDTNSATDVFTHDVQTGLTTRDSVASDGRESSADSQAPAISGDGRYVAFTSLGNNLVPGVSGSTLHIFVRDRVTGHTTLESIGVRDEVLGANSPSLSADGRFLTFNQLVGQGGGGISDGLFLRDRVSNQTVSLLPFSTLGGVWEPTISPDGQVISYGRFYNDVFYAEVFDRSTGQFSTVAPIEYVARVTAGGNVIAFESPLTLVGGDTNGTHDIFIAPFSALPGTPAPPASLTFTYAGSTLTLAWAPGSGGSSATEYVIEAGSLTHSTDLANFSTGTIATTFSASVSIQSPVFVRVRAANGAGVSLPSNEIVLGTAAPPGAPGALVASVTGTTITLSWTAGSGSIASYIIEAGSAPGRSDLANFDTGSIATTYTAVNVAAGTYFVRVRAVSAGGISPPSNESVVIVTSACPLPAVPTGLTRSVTGSAVTLAWMASAGATSYVLEAGTTAGSANLATSDLGSAATTFTAFGVAPGTYFVRVRSKNACGTSGPSNEASVIIQ